MMDTQRGPDVGAAPGEDLPVEDQPGYREAMAAADDLPWYANHTTLVCVAQAALDAGELDTGQEVVDFFEKPWHWPELHKAWCEQVDREKAAIMAERARVEAAGS